MKNGSSRPKQKKTPLSPWKPSKEVSVMAWIEDLYGEVLMVKQAQGKKFWTLPGGKVKPRESLLTALAREVREETGLRITVASPFHFYDRPKKSAITLLFLVRLRRGSLRRKKTREISNIGFKISLPQNSSPSAKFFWKQAAQNPSSLF